jgi:hypothetical protein
MHKKTKKALSKIFVLMLSVMLIGNSGIALAATDVTASHWANTQIESVSGKIIMPVYSDGTFKPDSVVTSLEVIVSIYRAVKTAGLLDNVQMGTITTKHEPTIKALGMPQMLAPYGSDTYPALAYALEYNILTLEEIKVFISGSTLTNVKKVNAVVFIAKALNAYKQDNLSKIILLSYKDSAEISLSAIKYVNLAIEQGIISSKGDAYGKFNPASSINRATLAVMTDGLYKLLATFENTQPMATTQPTTQPTTEPTSQPATPINFEAEKIFSGKVKTVNDADQTISVLNTSGKTESFSLEESTITEAGYKGTFESITIGAQIELTLKDGVVTTAALEKSLSRVEGTFVFLTDNIGVTNIRKSIKVLLPTKLHDFRNVYDDTLVTINGVPAKASDLKAGYKVIVLYDGYDAKRVIAYSELYEFTGIMSKGLDSKLPGKFEVKLQSGNIVTTTTTATGIAYINASVFNVGDIVKVTLKNGVLTRLEYIGQAKTVVGTLSGINIKKVPELTVTLSNSKNETYALASKVKLINAIGENALSIYDLRLAQEVTVDIGIGGITKVQLGRKIVAEPMGIKVTVSQVVDSSNILIVTDESNRVRTITFPVGSTYKATDYKPGMNLFIDGKAIADAIFEVIKITVQMP